MAEETVQEQENPTTVLIRMLAEAQAEMPNPKKVREGQKGYQKYKYATLDKVLDIRRAACQRVGGVGDRYTCRINGQVTYLWMEKGVWFVEAKE